MYNDSTEQKHKHKKHKDTKRVKNQNINRPFFRNKITMLLLSQKMELSLSYAAWIGLGSNTEENNAKENNNKENNTKENNTKENNTKEISAAKNNAPKRRRPIPNGEGGGPFRVWGSWKCMVIGYKCLG